MCSVMDGFLPPAPQLLPNPVIRLSSRRCARDIPDFASFLCPLMMRRCVRGCKQNANDDTLLSHRRPVPLPAFVIWQTGRKDSPCRGGGDLICGLASRICAGRQPRLSDRSSEKSAQMPVDFQSWICV